ncbi:sorting nexin-16 [Nilaparvata lugens]|uniref:sorting nexin-16 n=1 Tax=Nilaparvata lugens TaxID=108931 RepID=UPI000B990518|nr:sorting nexin-16 [Nilaparvata lugens]XP_039287182.1 sorting nexin-16 [Nilaparvata lugens]
MSESSQSVSDTTSRLKKKVSCSSSDVHRPGEPNVNAHERFKKYSSSSVLPLPRDYNALAIEAPSTLNQVNIPIVGYEVMEERARFTVYKLRIEDKVFGDCWFVFRRYTDFVRLCSKLKDEYPKLNLSLPKKRWFGNNFDARFIEERIAGLQTFIDAITADEKLLVCSSVREFFCLDDPPSCTESNDESRATFEALEETVYHLRRMLIEKEEEVEIQKSVVKSLQTKSLEWALSVCDKTKDCAECNAKVFKSLAELQQTITASNYVSSSEKPSSSLSS